MARKADRKVKTIAGRLVREIERKLTPGLHQDTLELFKKVLLQKKSDSNKIYSLHEPHTQCMSKSKEHKKYEFGSKVSITLKNNFVDRGYRGVKEVLGTNIITPDKPGKQRTTYQKQKKRKGFKRRAAIGYKYKRFSLEIRKYFTRNILSGPYMSIAAYEKLSVIAGFRINK